MGVAGIITSDGSFPHSLSTSKIFLLSSSSSRSPRGGKVRSARGHVAVRALVGEPALLTLDVFGRKMTFWDGDAQYVRRKFKVKLPTIWTDEKQRWSRRI